MISDNRKIIAGFSLFLFIFLLGYAGISTADEGVTVTDATGTILRFLKPPGRIVSLNPDFTGNVIALGASERLVGITDFCRWQDNTPSPERIGGLWHPNLERIVALKPDLVLASREGNYPGTISTLRSLHIPVFVSGQSSGFQDYFELIRQLGHILGREKEAVRLIGKFTDRINRIRLASADMPPVAVFLQVGVKPLVTINKDTLIGEMIEIAGGDNLAADLSSRYPCISRERVLADNPEVIIVAAMGSEGEAGVMFWEKFPELRAVRERRVYVIDPDLICRLSLDLIEGLGKIESFIRESRGIGTEGREGGAQRDEKYRINVEDRTKE